MVMSWKLPNWRPETTTASGHRHGERARRGRRGLCPARLHDLFDRVGARVEALEVEVAVGVGQLRGDEIVVGVEEIDFPVLQAGVAGGEGATAGQIVVDLAR